MPTKPASKPLQKPGTSKAFGSTAKRRKRKTTKPPTQGDKVVFAATRPAVLAAPTSCIDRVLPGLKPYHPNHKKK
eukprot:6491286-Amphidinium_carterae.1